MADAMRKAGWEVGRGGHASGGVGESVPGLRFARTQDLDFLCVPVLATVPTVCLKSSQNSHTKANKAQRKPKSPSPEPFEFVWIS